MPRKKKATKKTENKIPAEISAAVGIAKEKLDEGNAIDAFYLLQDQIIHLYVHLEQQEGRKLTPWEKKTVEGNRGTTPKTKLEVAKAATKAAINAQINYQEELKQKRQAEFEAKGGCEACHGRGQGDRN